AGAADDSLPLFEQAMSRAIMRVVVKRPHRAPPLAPGKVGETIGKLVRFDIYKPLAKGVVVQESSSQRSSSEESSSQEWSSHESSSRESSSQESPSP
ncbi:MAG: class I SAM-dependent methyltransferase, partial [bacterium]